jgi:hypothetical protein
MINKIVYIFVILLVNGITNTTPANLPLTILQFGFVLYFICTNRIDKAIFWHFIFFITSFTYYGDSSTNIDNIEIVSYNYAKFKLLGPISYSHALAIILMFIVNLKKTNNESNNGLFSKFYKLIVYFIITGFGIGLLGFIFSNYYLDGVINYGSYIIIIFIHANILLKNNNLFLKNEFNQIIIPLLSILPIVTFILHQINPAIVDSSAASFYSILVLPALLYQKRIILSIVGLFFLFHNMLIYGTSGKSLILLVVLATITLFLSLSKTRKQRFPVRSRLVQLGAFLFIFSIPTLIAIISKTYDGSSFVLSKIHQVTTLTNFLFLKSGVAMIAPSPFIRVASLINIIYEGLSNPFVLLLGKGYGGYFQDNLHYFSNLILSNGGFSDKAIATGHFYTGHDTIVTVPMFNGLLGLFLIVRLSWSFIKNANINFLSLSAIPFLLLAFYFDSLIGITGVLLLYSGDYNSFELFKIKNVAE